MKEINASIITIGDELLIGQTIDTNSAYISQQLNSIGIWVKKRIAVGDNREDILSSFEEEGRHSKIIIITGGLGPTADDITKPCLCEFFGSKLIMHDQTKEHIIRIFKTSGRVISERNIKQAEVPDNCRVLKNERGTAPGMWFEKDGVIYISLPGVPFEMKEIMEDEVMPSLRSVPGLPVVIHKTILTAGIGESTVADIIHEYENKLPSAIKLAYLPEYGQVRLRLTARGEDLNKTSSLLETNFSALKKVLEKWLVVDDDIPLQEVMVKLLASHQKTMATAESCTGGMIAKLITSVSGASQVYKGSVVAYDNAVKTGMLDVDPAAIEKNGAVSEETVKAMLEGIIKSTGADYGLATSGIMGPEGGSPEKPVGTIWIAAGNKTRILTSKQFFRHNRERNIELSSIFALNFLRRIVLADIQNAD